MPGYSPTEVAASFRAQFPRKFDQYSDHELVTSLQTIHPDVYGLIDPMLLGTEILLQPGPTAPVPKLRTGKPFDPAKGGYPLPTPGWHDATGTQASSPTGLETAGLMAVRLIPTYLGGVGGGVLGGLGGAATGPAAPVAVPAGVVAGRTIGAGVGATFGGGIAQQYERWRNLPDMSGAPRTETNWGTVGMEGALGTLPIPKGVTALGRVGKTVLYGGAQSVADVTGRAALEAGRLPTGGEALLAGGLGMVIGGGLGGVVEGVGAGLNARATRQATRVKAAAAQARDVEARVAEMVWEEETARVTQERAAAQQQQLQHGEAYAAELDRRTQMAQEADRLAQEGQAFAGFKAAATSRAEGVSHTKALKEKAALEQLAGLASDVGQGVAPPPDVPVAPPSLAQALAGESTGAPVGVESQVDLAPPPPPLVLSSPSVPRGMDQLRQQELPLKNKRGALSEVFNRPIEQTGEMGGAPPSLQEPHIPALSDEMNPPDRVYARGPNAGPRNRGEKHGRPRRVERFVDKPGGGQVKESYDSTLPAEDPGTYPPEVRREMAAMLWEMQEYPYQQVGGGFSRGMNQDGIDPGVARASGSTAGGATAGAPVYHDVRRAAAGSFPSNFTRATLIKHLEQALRYGRGTGLTDGAAQEARRRLALRASGKRGEGSRINSKGQRVRTQSLLAAHGDEGDALINWRDANGDPVPRSYARSQAQEDARGASDGELRHLADAARNGEVDPSEDYIQAGLSEAERRGLITPEQGDLRMEGPGGAKLTDFEGGPPDLPREVIEGGPPPTKPETRAALPSGTLEGQVRGSEEVPTGRRLFVVRNEAGEYLATAANAPGGVKWVKEWGKAHTMEDGELASQLAQRFGGQVQSEGALPPVRSRQPALPGGQQPSLPGAEGVRDQSIPTPEVADLPFALTPPPSKASALQEAMTARREQGSLFDRLKGEEGVVILTALHNDRKGLQKFLNEHEAEHGGEKWFARVEQAIQDGDWDEAWKTARAASIHSVLKARDAAQTPQDEAAITALLHNTPFNQTLEAQLVARVRNDAGVGTAPPAKSWNPTVKGGFPPTLHATQAGTARVKATLGPGGVTQLGPPTRPLSTLAPSLRSGTLDRRVMQFILDDVKGEGKAYIPGGPSSMRMFRQIGEDLYSQREIRALRELGVKMAPEDLAAHFTHAVSEAGRTLNMLKQWIEKNDEVKDAVEAMSFGAALQNLFKGLSGRSTTAPHVAGSRVLGEAARKETLDLIQHDSQVFQANMVANTLQKESPISMLRAIHDASYPLMLWRWSTALRDYVSTQGRYTTDSLAHAWTIPIATIMRDAETAALSTALVKERGFFGGQRGALPFKDISPKDAWQEGLQGMFDLSTEAINAAGPTDVRHFMRLLTETPEAGEQFLSTLGGENLRQVAAEIPVLRTLTDPNLQRVLSSFRTMQEMSIRTTIGSATMRALLRVKGLDPDVAMRLPTEQLIPLVGGQDAWENLLFTANAHALEGTFAGQLSKSSFPGAIVRAFNAVWPAKLAVPFPRFNFSSAPRWMWDHGFAGPLSLLEVLRVPLDAAGITAPKGTLAGGRLTRGIRADRIERRILPGLALKIGEAKSEMGQTMQELLSTAKEMQRRTRLVRNLERRAGAVQNGTLPQGKLPGITTKLEAAKASQQELFEVRDALFTKKNEAWQRIQDHTAEMKKLTEVLQDARGINAPNFSQYVARQSAGAGLFMAAYAIRSQEGAQGTKWYQYKIDRGEDRDPTLLDFRAFAPFAQWLFTADVVRDFETQTNWEGYHASRAAGAPLDRAVWENYEGKYTAEELNTQLAQAVFSISRTAGTSLTLADLVTAEGAPDSETLMRALVGTIGQFLGRATGGIGQFKDILAGPTGQWMPEEAKLRTPPKATREEPYRPLAAPLANVPFANRVIPETISATSGKPMANEYPWLRSLAGIGTTPQDAIEQERTRIGLPFRALYMRTTGDAEIDRLNQVHYTPMLEAFMYGQLDHQTGKRIGGVLQDPRYAAARTPAGQRDLLQKRLPDIKAAAARMTRASVAAKQYQAATVKGEGARKKARQLSALDEMLKELPAAAPQPAEETGLGGPPPGPTSGALPEQVGAPPPASPFQP